MLRFLKPFEKFLSLRNCFWYLEISAPLWEKAVAPDSVMFLYADVYIHPLWVCCPCTTWVHKCSPTSCCGQAWLRGQSGPLRPVLTVKKLLTSSGNLPSQWWPQERPESGEMFSQLLSLAPGSSLLSALLTSLGSVYGAVLKFNRISLGMKSLISKLDVFIMFAWLQGCSLYKRWKIEPSLQNTAGKCTSVSKYGKAFVL